MRSLHLRIFLSFWLIIVLTIFTAATLGFLYAERARSSLQSFEVSEAMIEASDALRERGRDGLVTWLESLPFAAESLIYIIDEQGRELLDRRLPAPVQMTLRRFARPPGLHPPRPRDTDTFRPPRPFAQLVGPAGEIYTLIVVPPQSAVARWLSERGRLTFIIIALLVSGGVSYLLARAISKPILRFRESTVAIAAGDLDTRIAPGVEKRRDEIGELAKDFNRMARELQLAWQRQAELTSNVSHELRSPLARLKVALELARGQHLPLDHGEAFLLEGRRYKTVRGMGSLSAMAGGSAELGLVARGQVAVRGGSSWLLPAYLHDPIEQQLVVLGRTEAPTTAERFVDFLLHDPEAATLVRAAGYDLPESAHAQPR